jgi:hypothetical protein
MMEISTNFKSSREFRVNSKLRKLNIEDSKHFSVVMITYFN